MKIAYFGFDLFFDCLKELHNNGHEIVKIFTCKVDQKYERNNRVYYFAKKHNIEITSQKPTYEDGVDLLKKGCELLFCAGYYHLIPFTDIIPGVNIHPSLLPIGRGPWPEPFVILKKMKQSGVTLHKLDAKFDTGDIVLQKAFAVSDDETLESLTRKSKQTAVEITKQFLGNIVENLQNAKAQAEGEYWLEPTDKERTFTLDDPYEKIDRITRAFYGYGCFLKIDNTVLKIEKALCKNYIYDIQEYEKIVLLGAGYLYILKMS